jgi:ABC-type transport system involved in cytochrome c biogenesis permease subunit
MTALFQHVSHTCFGLSYLLALLFECARLRWPQPIFRYGSLAMGLIGLLTHSAYLVFRQPTPATPHGALLAVAWVLAIFYVYGALHYNRQAWAIFVLPVVLGLVGLALVVVSSPEAAPSVEVPPWLIGDRFWGSVHGVLLLLAAVGICVGFLASVMYLVQANRLRNKRNPLGGLKILSLERLEDMNRRAVNLAFPLLSVGLLLGAVLLKHYHGLADNWLSVKVLGTVGLWLVFLLLLYLRYAAHVSGRRLAFFTILAFLLMLLVLVAAHPFAQTVTAGGLA